MAGLFKETLDNLMVVPVDLRGTQQRFSGVFKLLRVLRPLPLTRSATCTLSTALFCSVFTGLETTGFRVSKERKARRRLTRRQYKVLEPLTPALERYRRCCPSAGFVVDEAAMRVRCPIHVNIWLPSRSGLVSRMVFGWVLRPLPGTKASGIRSK